MERKAFSALISGTVLCILPAAEAAPVTIAAGETYTLTADLTLGGADTLDANGTVASPCIIVGNGHAIVAQDLTTGHVAVHNCVFQGLGGDQETSPALDITAGNSADVSITGSTFHVCGSIRLHLNDTATAKFNDNLLEDTGIAYIQDELVGSMYVPAFYANGSSTGTKVFQGNRIYRDAAHFDGVSDWLIGGYGDQFTNVLIGHRGVIRVRGNHVKVVGNFINPQYELTSPDVENIVVGSDDPAPDLVMEHNVLRSGEWVLRECQGEVRYNLIADMNGHAWIKGPHDCNVHHNIFVNYDTPDPNREAGIDAVYFTPHLNIYNNTFDGGGKIANLGVPAIHAGKGRLIERVSSNAITNFIIDSAFAAVSSTDVETQYDTNPPPGDARMHFADYNLFYNPDSPSQTDYTIAVEPDDVTPIAKGSDGFAKHDVHDAPGFSGPLPTAFPFASTDVRAGTVTVSAILSHYRDLYAPAAQSPLTGAGDPAFGANNNIGAIGQGATTDSNDQFGTFKPGTGGGPPPLHVPDAGTPAGGSGGTTGAGGGSSGGAKPGAGGTLGNAGNTTSGGTTVSASDGGVAAGGNAAASNSSDSGCGCELGARKSGSPWAGALLLLALRGSRRPLGAQRRTRSSRPLVPRTRSWARG